MTNLWSKTLLAGLLAAALCAGAPQGGAPGLESSDPKERAKAANELGKTKNPVHIPALQELLKDPVADVRADAVEAIIEIGTGDSLDPLIEATRDAMPSIQALAVDGLVNFYLPGYVKTGWMGTLKSLTKDLADRFRDPEPLIIQRHVKVAPRVIEAIGRVIEGGSSMESRANAARAAGILRGKQALPQLTQALRSKNTMVILESVRAIEKIREPGAGSALVPLVNDLDKDVQLAAIGTIGQLRVEEAVPDLVNQVKTTKKKDVRRAALTALAKIGDKEQRSLFLRYLGDNDKNLRAAAAEGLARAGDPEKDLQMVLDEFAAEKKETTRLSLAFAAVALGDKNYLSYLVDGLNSSFRGGEAGAFLIELARKPEIRSELYTPLMTGTKDQKIALAGILAHSGDEETVPHLERLSHDSDPDVAQAAIQAMKNLQARLAAS